MTAPAVVIPRDTLFDMEMKTIASNSGAFSFTYNDIKVLIQDLTNLLEHFGSWSKSCVDEKQNSPPRCLFVLCQTRHNLANVWDL